MTRNSSATNRSTSVLIETCDLVVDRIYESGRSGNAGDDRLSKLLGVSNQGGFRYLGSPGELKLVVLVSNFNDPDWPDHLDRQTGFLTYFGDNKMPGQDLHETPRRGNLVLRKLFDRIHHQPPQRSCVPPILVFRSTGTYRDVEFLGLAVPGVDGMSSTQDLVASWRSTDNRRFQNYRAHFTVLDIASVSRLWLNEIRTGRIHGGHAPMVWRDWVETGTYKALAAQPTIEYRTKQQQLPDDVNDKSILEEIRQFYADDPYGFEACATEIVQLIDPGFVSFDLTRHSRDGGRDAVGKYRVGDGLSAILADTALEAKCYGEGNGVGVRELSRLISRLRHRQIGVLVTTSYLNRQAYSEVKDDGHPIVIVAAQDIANVLRRHGLRDANQVRSWLESISSRHTQ